MIIIKDENGTEYKLEFNRKTVSAMEDDGFKPSMDTPNTMVDSLFYGAFQMHHRRIDRTRVREIWAIQRKKSELLTALTKEYYKPLEELMAEPEGEEDANPTWKEV